MRKEKLTVLLVFLAGTVLLLWTILPDQGLIKPFPLSEQEIYFRTYIWIATVYLAFMIFISAMWTLSDKAKDFFQVSFIFQACEFVEYFCNYNGTWFNIGFYPITVATIRFPVLFIFAVITFARWNK